MMPQRVAALAMALLLWPAVAYAEPTPDAPVDTYAVIVAHNTSVDSQVAPLLYADDDGVRYLELFRALSVEAHLLASLDNETRIVFGELAGQVEAPTHDQLQRTLEEVGKHIAEGRSRGRKSRLFVVFAGHGGVDEDGVGYLSLADGKLTRHQLLETVVKPQWADRTHLFIDSCNAYYMVRSRGDDGAAGKRSYDDELAAFLESRSSLARWPGLGVFLSTAGAAEVHEWDEYGGGVFSHQLRSGLLGAADVNGDFAITYAELEAYLGAANASVKNPKARIDFYSRAPGSADHEVLVDLAKLSKATFLEVPRGTGGRFDIEDSRGLRYADFNSAGDSTTRVALLWDPVWRAPHYFVRTEGTEARISPDSSSSNVVELQKLAFVARADHPRGTVAEAYRENLYETPFGAGFFFGYHARTNQVAAQQIRPTSIHTVEREVGTEVTIGYFASPSHFDLSGVQHNASLSAATWFWEHVGLELVGEYGNSRHSASATGEAFQLHRMMLGVGALVRWSLPLDLRLGANARAGHQWLFHDGGTFRGDSLAFRAESALTVGYQLADGLGIEVRPGMAFDVVTVDSKEQVETLPLLGAQLGYQW